MNGTLGSFIAVVAASVLFTAQSSHAQSTPVLAKEWNSTLTLCGLVLEIHQQEVIWMTLSRISFAGCAHRVRLPDPIEPRSPSRPWLGAPFQMTLGQTFRQG